MTRRSRAQDMREGITHRIAELQATPPSDAPVTLHVQFHATESDPDGAFHVGDIVEARVITIPARRPRPVPAASAEESGNTARVSASQHPAQPAVLAAPTRRPPDDSRAVSPSDPTPL